MVNPKKVTGETERIIPKHETETVEFKTSFQEEVIETLVAFANTRGGMVYIGVSDDETIKGLDIGKETIAQWINEVKNKTAPVIIPDAELIEEQGKTIVVLKIQEYPVKPVSVRGKYYKRIKNANHLLSVSEVVNLHLQSLNTSWDAYPDPVHSLDDISLDKVQQCIELMRSRGVTIAESPLSFLFKYDLIREEKPTNAAYLLFKHRDSIATTIELGRFQDIITIKDTSRTQADIVTQVEQVLDFVRKHINVALIITGEAQNTQKWQYPLEAIREIVLNMIIHRDYRALSDSVVKIFDDKIEFYNPGKLPEGITVHDLLENNYKSTPRNRAIAEFFKNLGWIEKYGSGIGRVVSYFKQENLPLPEFRTIGEGFQVTVFSNPTAGTVNVGVNVGANVGVSVGVNDLLKIIADNPGINTKKLHSYFDVTDRTIERWLKQLREENRIEFRGAAKTGGYWKVE